MFRKNYYYYPKLIKSTKLFPVIYKFRDSSLYKITAFSISDDSGRVVL